MEFLQYLDLGTGESRPRFVLSTPACIARFHPIFWEPLPGTGERIVALVALEPDERSTGSLSAGTYCVLPVERLRAMLGRQRGNAAFGVLQQAAQFMTQRQQEGRRLMELEAPFQGFAKGPMLMARGHTVEQLLDAAVRSVSAFGSADDLVDEGDITEQRRHSIKTGAFLTAIKRQVAGDNPDVKARFERTLRPHPDMPELTVDYAFNRWLLQVTSLPSTPRQSINTLKESQSKLYEIDMIRRAMEDNPVRPVLLVNTDALIDVGSNQAIDIARAMLDRLQRFTTLEGVDLIESGTPQEAAQYVSALG